MKRTVTVTIEIDTVEYDEDLSSREAVIELAKAMLRGEADLPEDEVVIGCEGAQVVGIWD